MIIQYYAYLCAYSIDILIYYTHECILRNSPAKYFFLVKVESIIDQ